MPDAASPGHVSGPPQDELTEWEREQALAFCRHYDSLLWVVTSLLATSNAALLGLGGRAMSIQVGLLGVGLSVATVFFAASFRQIRGRILCRLNTDRWLSVDTRGRMRQWPWYVAFFAGSAALWFSLLFSHFPSDDLVWVVLAGATTAVFLLLYGAGTYRLLEEDGTAALASGLSRTDAP